MKKIFLPLVCLLVLISCNQKSDTPKTSDAPVAESEKKLETAKNFDDPERILLCEKLIRHLKEDKDLDVALSLIKAHIYEDETMSSIDEYHIKNEIIDVKKAITSYKIVPKENWLIKFDTCHLKTKFVYRENTFIKIYEKIIIPVDRGQEPEDEHLYVLCIFDISELEPSLYLIDQVSLASQNILKLKSNRSLVYY